MPRPSSRPRPAASTALPRRRGSARLRRADAASRTDRCAAAVRPRAHSSRSSDSARWAPRLVGTSAWISSTMTVSTERSASRAFEVSRRYSDSGVVIRMSAGSRWKRARSLAGVSPVRTATAGTWNASPRDAARSARSRRSAPAGCARRRRPAPSAARRRGPGSRRRAVAAGVGSNIIRLMAQRKAVERLAAAGGREDQRRFASRDRRPALRLGRRRRGETTRGTSRPPRRWKRSRTSDRFAHVSIISALRRRLLSLYSACYLCILEGWEILERAW